MTLRQAYEYALIESNKLKAPSLLLEDYIYLFNKAIQQKVNEIYNRFDINQQSSDDLRVLQTTARIAKAEDGEYFNLPEDYLHLLNCIAVFKGNSAKSERCGSMSYLTEVKYPCRRMTADLEAGLINNYYFKPDVRRPYYYLITDANKVNSELNNNPSSSEKDRDIDTLFKEQGTRDTNPSTVTLKLEYGESARWEPKEIILTYLRSPRYVTMTEEDLLSFEDNTPVLEFPDYMCYEIINTYVKLLLENASDPRLQTNMAVNQSIAVAGNK